MNIVFPNMPVTSGQLSNSLVDETGTGSVVFNTSPTLVAPVLTGTVSGSTAAGGTLTLTGTSSATKSVTGIKLGSVVTVDEVNGRVGIATTVPTSKLEVIASGAVYNVAVTSQSDVGDGIAITSGTTGINNRVSLIMRGNDKIGGAISVAREDSGATWRTYMSFYTNNITGVNTVNIQEKMRITSDGNVGIGTTTPAVKLDVAGLIKTYGYTVAALPAGVTGARAYVTDATSPTYNGSLTGGGTVVVPVFYNGSAWVSA